MAFRTAVISISFSLGTCNTTLKVVVTSMSSMTAALLVVPMTSSLRPLGGCFFSSTSRVCRMPLLKRGPMATYSSSRSMSSRMMMERTDCGQQEAG